MSDATCVKAILAVMKDVGAIGKDSTNVAQKFKFRGVDAVINAVSPALIAHGVIVIPTVEDYHYSTITIGQNRTEMGHARVKVNYLFIDQFGDIVTATVAAEAMDSGDKATAKAMSVAFRTALLQTLCLPTDDADPDHESYNRADKPAVGTPAVSIGADPWATAKPPTQLKGDQIVDAPLDEYFCNHGKMMWSYGVSQKNGKEWYAFCCVDRDRTCKSIWYLLGSNGVLRPQ